MDSHPPGSTPRPGPVRVAVIGPGTAGAFARRGVRADLVPERFVAESLLEAFPGPGRPANVCCSRVPRSRATCFPRACRRGFAVDVLPVYRTVTAAPDAADLAACATARRRGDFTSSSTVTNFCDLVGELPDPQPFVVSIGPVTSATARDRGLRVDVEADPHTLAGLVAALFERRGPSGAVPSSTK